MNFYQRFSRNLLLITSDKLLNGDNFILFLQNIYNPREINTN